MEHLAKLIDRIIDRVNVNLREPAFDVGPHVRELIPLNKFTQFYAFYGLTLHHPLHFHFKHSNMAGSYFLGKCIVDHSVVYKSDIRGDELKASGDIFTHQGLAIPLHDDEVIRIRDSYLIKNLVHNHSHDPESPEEFLIQNSVSMHYANIHGSPIEGSFLGPFCTVDLTTLHDCVIGTYAYIQTQELSHRMVEPGQVWIRAAGAFDFNYRFPQEVLEKYIHCRPGQSPRGLLPDFVEQYKPDFQRVFEVVDSKPLIPVPDGASLSRYAVVKGATRIAENVLVAQRAYLEDAFLGKGSNAQENCYIVASRLAGHNITAHGGKVICAELGERVFVGFNAFLYGKPDCKLGIGAETIVMPHTIIDLEEPLEIPPRQLVWGCIRNRGELEQNSISLDLLCRVKGRHQVGGMCLEGSGAAFVEAFQHRIDHILQANGAYFDGTRQRGHSQEGQNISFSILQPYPEGPFEGLYPTIDIRP